MNELEGMLLELKDTSELMIDLAYSSLLYSSTEIAGEVMGLEEKMDEVGARIQASIAEEGKKVPENIEKLMTFMRLQMAIEEIANAAASIADVVLRGLGKHPVVCMSIRESDVIIDMAIVSEGSEMCNKTLGEMRLSSLCGMFIIAIKRDKKYIYGPGRNTMILSGDVLLAKGPDESSEFFKKLADGKETLSE